MASQELPGAKAAAALESGVAVTASTGPASLLVFQEGMEPNPLCECRERAAGEQPGWRAGRLLLSKHC